MNWIGYHRLSEQCASAAEACLREGKAEEARRHYAQSAEAEERALGELDPSKTKTYGITAVSTASLYFKARRLADAERVASASMKFDQLPYFARHQLEHLVQLLHLVQVVWAEDARQIADRRYTPGEIIVSVDGGDVVPGGAPLHPVLDKIKTLGSFVHRAAEFMNGTAYRRNGAPSKSIQDAYRPWIFNAPPGSFQIAVAMHESHDNALQARDEGVTGCFFKVLRLSCTGSDEAFAEAVPSLEYRGAFMKLARDLAPSGRVFEILKVRRAADESQTIVLDPDVRQHISARIRRLGDSSDASYGGTLRAVHLDQDWLEVDSIRVHGIRGRIDNAIGPMINKPVTVRVVTKGGKHRFVSIDRQGWCCFTMARDRSPGPRRCAKLTPDFTQRSALLAGCRPPDPAVPSLRSPLASIQSPRRVGGETRTCPARPGCRRRPAHA